MNATQAPTPPSGGWQEDQLTAQLGALGVQAGDLLFVHSSFKSLGPVAGGAATVVAALERAVGPQGTVAMPSFNLKGERAVRVQHWDVATTPSTVGWLTEYFRQMPGTLRSDHYSHAVAARGRDAADLVADHRATDGLESPWDQSPWGKTYGDRSPMIKALHAGAKVMLLGVDYHCVTYVHVVEVMAWHHWRQDRPAAPYIWLDRDKLGAYWEALGRVRLGSVGNATTRLFDAADFVQTLLAAVQTDPRRWARYWPEDGPKVTGP